MVKNAWHGQLGETANPARAVWLKNHQSASHPLRPPEPRAPLFYATLAFGLLATACSSSSSPGWCFESGPTFAIVVADAATGVRICDATVKVTDAADSSIGGPGTNYYKLNSTGSSSLDCAYAGLPVPSAFSITASRIGYADQTVQGMLKPVIRNHCETLLSEAGTSTNAEEFTIALVKSP